MLWWPYKASSNSDTDQLFNSNRLGQNSNLYHRHAYLILTVEKLQEEAAKKTARLPITLDVADDASTEVAATSVLESK